MYTLFIILAKRLMNLSFKPCCATCPEMLMSDGAFSLISCYPSQLE
jgi:hypothetical protein